MLHLALIGGSLLYAGYKSYKERTDKRKTAITVIDPTDNTPEQSLATTESVLDEELKDAKHYLTVSTGALGLSVLGTVYPVLNAVVVPLVLYTTVPLFQAALKGLFEEHRLRASVVDSIAVIGTLSTRYYVASSLAVSLFFLAQRLLLATEDNSKKQLISVFGQQPRSVWLLREAVEVEIPFESLRIGDVIVLNAGEMIPIDGYITEGIASIDQHALTGEAQPVERTVGDAVMAATLVVAGKICVMVEKAGQQTVAAQIGEVLKRTANYRTSLEFKSTLLADQMALPTLFLGGVAFASLGVISATATVSCNFSEIIRISSPIGMLNFLKIASEQGILFKDGRSLELLHQIDTVVFDKTGTLTLEQPHVGFVHCWGNATENEILRLAAAAEHKQTHPVAKAILQAAHDRDLTLPPIDNARYDIGYGIKVNIAHRCVRVGSSRFISNEGLILTTEMEAAQHHCHDNGYSLVYVAVDDSVIGTIELHATLRPEIKTVIQGLKKRGLQLYILSGDHEKPTQKLAQEVGITNYFANTLPEGKAQLIEHLQATGKSVCFIGDGINDVIALKKATVSISLKGATSIATDTAGIVLMNQNLSQLCYLFELSDGLNKNMQNSFAAALIPGAVGLGGVFLFHFGIYSTILLYISSMAAGGANAMLPLLTYKDKDATLDD
ncbi:heavy metal translocating P-type ATPase [Beggiatoa leptomitoformis]|uniref:Heavy metal translocating P-type ATPase n=1 Tax=Beggiatoa leptomitoformis TaxID=288004 RepID=A0A2N9YBK6_9GAMM|nr:heavy metal translocating P-type ATPase [Beggiatoa leptomitoformis]AUI67804.1 heavy metal translocating P-type ATPase [Beggiatoa leptomitoformis]QGX03502.1 heavy metal translocating P-type ATPase [Beggiatoa leptomitoformis]